MITTGLTNTLEGNVTQENTAVAMGSGSVAVFATPAMIALMEGCCAGAVADCLEEGQTTVGTALSIEHVSASPVGITVRAECELTEVDGRALTFNVTAWDAAGKIGEGTHQRFIVESEKFLSRAQKKVEA